MTDLAAVIPYTTVTADQGVHLYGAAEAAGRNVRIIGDVNGDGLADLMITANGSTQGGYASGAVYVVFGRQGGFNAAEVALSGLDGTNGFKIVGAPNDRIGQAIGSGDFNGDGYADLLIGSATNTYAGSNAGGAYVVYGAETFNPTLSVRDLDGSNGFLLTGPTSNWVLGTAVSSAGDIDGDGRDDVIISSPGLAGSGPGSGVSYIMFGYQTEYVIEPATSANAAQGVFLAGAAQDRSGTSLAAAGDLNGDGRDDLAIGAPGGGGGAGAVYVLFGRDGAANPFDGPINLTQLSATGQGICLTGPAANANFGQSLASAGDVNGDGRDDLLVGGSQRAWVIFGGTTFTSDFSLAGMAPSQGFTITGTGSFGYTNLSSAGDMNGDGFDEIIVGAYTQQVNGQSLAGRAYLIYGRADFGTGITDIQNGATGVVAIEGVVAWDLLGQGVSGGGDLNGDGRPDIAVGSYSLDNNPGDSAGGAVVIYAPVPTVNFVGGIGDDTHSGGDGDDVLDGGDGADKLYGGLGVDDLVGGAGGDLLDGGAGADQMAGGDGDDTYVVDDTGDAVSELGGSGVDRVRASVNFTLGDGVENLQLTGTANISGLGNSLANQIDGNSGENIIFGGGGNDIIRGAGGLDQLQGDSGSDQMRGGDGDDQIFGGADNDWIYGDADNDALFGGGGNDIIDGGTGADTLYGEAGADQLSGGDGDDYLTGGADNDLLRGGAGSDSLEGGTGDDTYFIDDTLDRIFENPGEGNDIVRASISYTLGDNLERLILEGTAANGTGNGLANVITGNAEANVLDGAAGADTISGGLGDDTLIGGTGNDILTGGGGADTFVIREESVFSSSDPQGRSIETDTISDYAIGQDIIDLADIDAIAGGADDAFTIVGAFDGAAGRMTLTFAGGVTILLLDIDGDRVADYRLRINGDVRADTADWVL